MKWFIILYYEYKDLRVVVGTGLAAEDTAGVFLVLNLVLAVLVKGARVLRCCNTNTFFSIYITTSMKTILNY